MSEVIAVASGKGGVGKSFFSSNFAMSLKAKGFNPLLVDADLGGANLHDFVGVRMPAKGLYDFLKEKVSIGDVITRSKAGVDFVGGTSDILGMANITNFERMKIVNRLKELDYDYIVLDLGAGTSFNIVDFFNMAEKKIMVMNSEPTSLENSYGFLKVALYRQLEQAFRKADELSDICKKLRSKSMNYPNIDSLKAAVKKVDASYLPQVDKAAANFKTGMVLNMLKLKKELKIFEGFDVVAKKYLGINIEKLGFMPYDIKVSECVKLLKPFYLTNEGSDTSSCIDDVRDRVLSRL